MRAGPASAIAKPREAKHCRQPAYSAPASCHLMSPKLSQQQPHPVSINRFIEDKRIVSTLVPRAVLFSQLQ